MAGDHLYTTSGIERDTAFAFINYLEEGTACYVYTAPSMGTTPFFRCFNSGTGDHFYTTLTAERDNAVGADGYVSEGTACHVFAGNEAGTVPLYRLYNKANGDHFYTTSQTEATSAVYAFGYQSEGIACHVFGAASLGTTPLYRLVQVPPAGLNPSQSSWAILLCKFKGDTSEPPAAQGVPSFRTVCENFFTKSNLTYNAVKYFADMTHGKLDLTGSQVFGWLQIEASLTGRDKNGDPIFDKSQTQVIDLARYAAKDAGIAVDKFAGVVVIMNTATGWAQGSPGSVAMDWRRVDGRNFDGTLGPRAPGGGNGMEAFGQEMGHGYGLDHSRMDGSNVDYLDQWDSMSTMSSTYRIGDPDYCARGPGLNAWNMRCRGWLDESRIWKIGAANAGNFCETVQLRPLHQRGLPGWLGAELPGIGAHSPYLVEFRVPEMWDAGLPSAVVLVHRFSGAEEAGQTYNPGLLGQDLGTHSYVMSATNGQFSLQDGDVVEIGNGPFARVKVLTIDRENRIATVQICYSQSAKTVPKVKITAHGSGDSCTPPLVEGATATFGFAIDGLQCSQGYTIKWSVVGATPVDGHPTNLATYSLALGDPNQPVTVSVSLTLDDGTAISDALTFQPISIADAALQEFICKVLRERLKPIPWWEWEPERLRNVIGSMYSRERLQQAVRALEAGLRRLGSL